MLEDDLDIKNKERRKFLKKYLYKGMRILELGCAEGSLGAVVKHDAALAYYGAEPSQDARIAETKLDGVWNSINKIPSYLQFDMILAFHVLEHINNTEEVISGFYRLLSDSGPLIIEVPNFSGNKLVPWDFNKEHIHLFSSTSISNLIEKQKFHLRELGTGYYESAIYNDSMRIIACKRKNDREVRCNLYDRFKRFLGDRFVIYGGGGDFESLVSPYIRSSNILCIIDSSKNKIGSKVFGRTVKGPEEITKNLGERFLIATYRYQEEIFDMLNKKGIAKSQIVTLKDIFADVS